MKLPELPKKRKHIEADITPDVMDWFFNNYDGDVSVELKQGKNKIKEHQQIALKQVANGIFKYKIPDMGRLNPFDFIILKKKKVTPFLVICKNRVCEAIRIYPDDRHDGSNSDEHFFFKLSPARTCKQKEKGL